MSLLSRVRAIVGLKARREAHPAVIFFVRDTDRPDAVGLLYNVYRDAFRDESAFLYRSGCRQVSELFDVNEYSRLVVVAHPAERLAGLGVPNSDFVGAAFFGVSRFDLVYGHVCHGNRLFAHPSWSTVFPACISFTDVIYVFVGTHAARARWRKLLVAIVGAVCVADGKLGCRNGILELYSGMYSSILGQRRLKPGDKLMLLALHSCIAALD